MTYDSENSLKIWRNLEEIIHIKYFSYNIDLVKL